MMQSTSYKPMQCGLHVAIIMDGNGRWATSTWLPRGAGHRAGADAVRRTVEAAPSLGIDTLTLFAFSAGNWERPAERSLSAHATFLRLLPRPEKTLGGAGNSGEHHRPPRPPGRRSAAGRGRSREGDHPTRELMHLRIAVDYSARDAILRAARRMRSRSQFSPDDFAADPCRGQPFGRAGARRSTC